MNRNRTFLALALSATLIPLASAQDSQTQNTQTPKTQTQDTQSSAAQQQQTQAQGDGGQSGHPAVMGRTVVVNGTIDAIDPAKRTITIRGDQGGTVTIVAGKDLANFNELKKGQQITATYTEAVALEMMKPGEPAQPGQQGAGQQSAQQGAGEPSQASAQQSAGAGQQGGQQAGAPGMSEVMRATVVAKVTKVDPQNNWVTLQGPQGEQMQLRVQNKQALLQLEEGDRIQITYAQAAAIAVEPRQGSATGESAPQQSQPGERAQ